MKVRPIGKRFLLEVLMTEDKTQGGIYIPASAQEKTQEGIIKAIGEEIKDTSIKVGDRVIYDKYAGSTIKVDDVEHLILKLEDVIAVCC